MEGGVQIVGKTRVRTRAQCPAPLRVFPCPGKKKKKVCPPMGGGHREITGNFGGGR